MVTSFVSVKKNMVTAMEVEVVIDPFQRIVFHTGKFYNPINFAGKLKQLFRKSRQLIALQLQCSKGPETLEEAIVQSSEPVASQVQLQQSSLEGMMNTTSGITNADRERIKDMIIQIFQQILCQVQLF